MDRAAPPTDCIVTFVICPLMSGARAGARSAQLATITATGRATGSTTCHATAMLIRDQPATELTIATRILARADALAPEGRITLRLHDVIYVAGRGVSNHTMTPYDVVSVLVADGTPLLGAPPDDIEEYISAHRGAHDAESVGRGSDGVIVAARSLRACAVALLARRRGERGADPATLERTWEELVAEARIAGALIGAFPTDDATPS